MSLRHYQSEAVSRIESALRKYRRVVFSLPTGGGKTRVALAVAKRHGGALWLTHRRELRAQVAEQALADGVSVQIGGPLTARFPTNGLLVVDECHHGPAASWAKAILRHDGPVLGLTATPARNDGIGLADAGFKAVVQGPSVADLILAGHLVRADIFAPVGGDPVGDPVRHYRTHLAGRPTLCFATTIAHGRALADAFNSAGIAAKVFSYDMPRLEREEARAGLRSGSISVAISVEVFTEGFDVPWVSGLILVRRTESAVLLQQMIGRGLRPWPKKDRCIILDHVGVTKEHQWYTEQIAPLIHAEPTSTGATGASAGQSLVRTIPLLRPGWLSRRSEPAHTLYRSKDSAGHSASWWRERFSLVS